MEVNERIRKKRIALGMSQEELAIKCGYSDRSTIAKIEKGQRDVQLEKLDLFAKALETTSIELLGKDKGTKLNYILDSLTEDEKNQLLEYAKYLYEKHNKK